VVEDDPLARKLLTFHLQRIAPDMVVVGEYEAIGSARAALVAYDYEVVFLDVQLKDGTAFDLVPDVKPDAGIIFITGCDSHAVRAFEVNALDYIVKPVTAPRLQRALGLVPRSRAASRDGQRLIASDSVFLRGAAASGRFVAVSEIVAILSSENYTEVLLRCGERWFMRRTMLAWERLLPHEVFQRVHRTALVNIEHVERVSRMVNECGAINVAGFRQPIQISRRRWTLLRAKLSERSG
jgi:two-component system LytT family response regulator